MTDLRKAAEMALKDWLANDEGVVKFGMKLKPKWVSAASHGFISGYEEALRQALAQPEQGNSSLNYPNTESNTPFVDAVNISQERVDETVKSEHEPVFDCPRCGHCCPKSAWQQREWVGLKDADIAETMRGNVEGSNMLPYSFARAIEAKLKEKNT